MHVRLLVRGPSLAESMSTYLSSRLTADSAVSVEHGAEVVALHGDDRLETVTIRLRDGSTRRVQTCARFIMVGAAPNTGWLAELIRLDDEGFIVTGKAAGGASPYVLRCRGSSRSATYAQGRRSVSRLR